MKQIPLVKTTTMRSSELRAKRNELHEELQSLMDDRKRETAKYRRAKEQLDTDIKVLTRQILDAEQFETDE